jgi:tetratricopeptide (TPR) repeat protein
MASVFSLRRSFVPYSKSINAGSLLILILLASLTVVAQTGGRNDAGTGGRNTIQGRIYLPADPKGDLLIKVRIDSTNSTGLSVVADQDGAFTFRNLEPGPYYLKIDAGEEFEPYKETVNIDRETSRLGPRVLTIPVYLRLKPNSPLASKPTVDASLASVPKPALERYNKARELAQGGKAKDAIAELKAAIHLFAEFALAFNELGVQHLKLGQLDPAIESLRQAVKLAPEAFSPRLNYGIALLNKKEFPQAEAELRQAIRKNEASPTAHMYLGLALINLQNHEDAAKELQRAISTGGAEMSLAHYYLGGIYWGRREYKLAADELETYLKLAPQATDAERVRKTIQELRKK